MLTSFQYYFHNLLDSGLIFLSNIMYMKMFYIFSFFAACDCYTPGSNNPASCEQYGGQCNCKPGYGGRRCDHCLAGYYGNPSTGCIGNDMFDSIFFEMVFSQHDISLGSSLD